MPDFFDRQGQPLELMDWATKFEDTAYRNVAVDFGTRDGAEIMVSTVWEGMSSPLPLSPATVPIGIFETAVIIDGEVQLKRRWDTEEEAIAKHGATCRFFLKREPDNGEVREEILRKEAEQRAASREHPGE